MLASQYLAQDVQIRQPLTNFEVVADPLLNYTYVGAPQTQLARDVWNESFENPLNTTNHYWYGTGKSVVEGTIKRNSTLDSGFEEVSSSSLNPNVNLPSWFIYRDNAGVTVKTSRSDVVKNNQSYSAYVETRFVNTSTQQSYTWFTPYAIYSACASGASYTIDDNTGTQWTHTTTETHWVIYNLNQSYSVKNVRVYTGASYLITDVNVYVSDDPGNFGTAVVQLWDPLDYSSWNVSPDFYKQGKYIKLEFITTHFKQWLTDAFYEFDAYIQTQGGGHIAGGIDVPQDYFVRIPYVYLNDAPVLKSFIFLDDAGAGSGHVDAYYLLEDVQIQNASAIYHIIYVMPVTAIGSPTETHFTNTTYVKYIYNITTINTFDYWVTFTRNIKNDYTSIWGQVYGATIAQITIENDFYNPQTSSETNTPYMKTYCDGVSLTLSSQGNEEELPNGGFEAPGWVKLQENEIADFNYTKDALDSKAGTTSYFMNATGDTSGGSGTGFSATKNGVVAIDESSIVREINDTNGQRLHGFIKVENFSNILDTYYSYVAIRLKFVSLSNSSDVRYLYYLLTLYGSPPADTSTEKYIELVKFYDLQKNMWYEVSRRPMSDIGWQNVKITQIALIVAFYYGPYYSSSTNANVRVRFDSVGIDLEKVQQITIRDSQRSTDTALHGNYSLKQTKTQEGGEIDIYECGAENSNNSFYIAFPYYANVSIYFYVSSLLDIATIQISLAVDDGPTYGKGYLYELIYYYGSSSAVSSVFVSQPNTIVEVSSSITTSSWIHLEKNWTLDLPSSWPIVNPRVEALALRIWTKNSIITYWDLAAFHGTWYGVEKTINIQSINSIYLRKFNTTDFWNATGDIDPGTDDFVDDNASNVDGFSGRGTHSNFTNEQYGPDYKYDFLSEQYTDNFLQNMEHYVDNNNSNVDSYANRGYNSNFTAEQYGPDSIYDPLTEQYMGPGVNTYDYVDNNSSDVDSSPSIGTHSNFTAEQYGPDLIYDILAENNTNPPPNDITDYVDNNSSNVDGSPSIGFHSNFTAEQYGPDSIYDTLTENNTFPLPNDVTDYVDNMSNVDGVADIGTHSNFTAEQYGPDSIYDTLTEKFTGTLTNSTEHYVNQTSNVDGIADIGTHSNFTAERYGPDSIFDTLTEYNTGQGTGAWTTPTAVYSRCGQESGYEATKTMDDNTGTDWRHYLGEMHWIVYDMSTSMLITQVRIFTGPTPQQYTVENMSVYVSDDPAGFNASNRVVLNWSAPLGGWAASPSFNAKGRYIRVDNINPTAPNDQLKFCFYEFDAWTMPNYELDLEIQWVNVKFNETSEQLCIYTGTMGAEDLHVDVWNGTTWINLVTDLYQGWNNITVTTYLTNSTFIIRFKGATDVNDTVQDSWQIDAALLHVWTPGVDNYALDLEAQWTNVDYVEYYEQLCIRTANLTSELLRVDYWTGTGWTTIMSNLTANTWNNISVSLTSSIFTIRFKGTQEINDSTQDNWQIDTVLLHVWTPDVKNYELDLEVQWTNVDYSELYEELCIYARTLGSENLSVDVWTISGWVNVIASLNPNSWNNISVSGYLKASTFTIRFKGTNDTGDSTQDNWQIDTALLHLWTPDIPNYKLDLEVEFTNIDYSEENEELCIRTGSLGSEPIIAQIWVPGGGGWHTLFNPLSSNSWNNASVSYWLTSSTFTVRFLTTFNSEDTIKDSYQIDTVLLHVWTIQGYQLDLERQFTNVDYDEMNEILCICSGNLTAGDLHVDVWTGNQWMTVLTDLSPNSWNNISVISYLNSPTFTIRFKGGYEVSEDTTQDTWQIDAVLLHVWTFEGYQIDLEVQFTNVASNYKAGELRIYIGTVGTENLKVDYWTGSNWITLIQALKPTSWNTASIPLDDNVTIRFKGSKETDDTTQDSWQIDAVLLHTWYVFATQTISRANATSSNQWYYKWWDIQKITVINGTGSYDITANSTLQGILSCYDNDWPPEDTSGTYDNDTSGYVKYNVTDFRLTPYGKNIAYQDYIQINYTILFCRPLGVFKFTNNNQATAANEQDQYGKEYWLINRKPDGTYTNYVEYSSTTTVTYLPDF